MVDVDMQECTLSNVNDMMRGKMVQHQIEGASYTTVLPRLINDSVIDSRQSLESLKCSFGKYKK